MTVCLRIFPFGTGFRDGGTQCHAGKTGGRYFEPLAAGGLCGPLPAVQLVGTDPLSKQLVAYHSATRLNRRLHRLNTEVLPLAPPELEMLARLWERESRLLPLVLYLDAEDLGATEMERSGALSRFLSRSEGLFFVGIREFTPRLGRGPQVIDVAKPTSAEQQSAWAAALGPSAADSPARLAGQFSLNMTSIEISLDWRRPRQRMIRSRWLMPPGTCAEPANARDSTRWPSGWNRK
jgi:hypothetical protein